MTRYFSTKKAMIRLGYAPVWELDEGVKRTVGWFWEVCEALRVGSASSLCEKGEGRRGGGDKL